MKASQPLPAGSFFFLFCFVCSGTANGDAAVPGHPRGRASLGVRHTADEHGADGEDLLGVGVGGDVAEAHAGQAAEGKVKGSDVGAADGRASQRAVNVGCLQTFAQLVEPPLEKKQKRGDKSMQITICAVHANVFSASPKCTQ